MTSFVSALLHPGSAPPSDISAATRDRFDVYRNNVAVSLTEALETAFPVVRSLVGDTFFKAMAGVFLRCHLPGDPRLALYGREMPAFLETFAPAKDLPYLPDIARLEQALRESYHAADAVPLDPAKLMALTEEDLLETSLIFAPATRLRRSKWPIHSICKARGDTTLKPQMTAETVLITRPGYDPRMTLIAPKNAGLVDALYRGQPLGQAASTHPEADLSDVLGILLGQGAVTILDRKANE